MRFGHVSVLSLGSASLYERSVTMFATTTISANGLVSTTTVDENADALNESITTETVLHKACAPSSFQGEAKVRELVRRGANVNAKTLHRTTPLHIGEGGVVLCLNLMPVCLMTKRKLISSHLYSLWNFPLCTPSHAIC